MFNKLSLNSWKLCFVLGSLWSILQCKQPCTMETKLTMAGFCLRETYPGRRTSSTLESVHCLTYSASKTTKKRLTDQIYLPLTKRQSRTSNHIIDWETDSVTVKSRWSCDRLELVAECTVNKKPLLCLYVAKGKQKLNRKICVLIKWKIIKDCKTVWNTIPLVRHFSLKTIKKLIFYVLEILQDSLLIWMTKRL